MDTYKHTLRTCNTYYFPTTPITASNQLIGTSHYIACLAISVSIITEMSPQHHRPSTVCTCSAVHLKYLGTSVRNQNCIQKDINSRLKSRNAFCHSVQNLLSSSLLSNSLTLKFTELQFFLLLCETWSLRWMEKRRC